MDFGILSGLEDGDFDVGFAGRHGLVKINAVIHGANQHRLRAEVGIVEGELALRVGLRVPDRLHAALQLNEHYRDAGSGFAGGAIFYGSVNCSCRAGMEKQARQKEQAKNYF